MIRRGFVEKVKILNQNYVFFYTEYTNIFVKKFKKILNLNLSTLKYNSKD